MSPCNGNASATTSNAATASPQHMSPEEFRRLGRQVVDWIAAYMERVRDLPPASDVRPGDVANMLPESPPERGESLEAALADLDRIILPGITHWQSGRFFGYFPANASGPAILAEMLSAGLGVQGMLWSTSPACTEVETRMLDWLAEALGLPERFTSRSETGGGVIQGTASEAVLVALLAARARGGEGAASPVVYASSQAHSSVTKAAMISGLGREGVRLVEVDGAFAMDPTSLARAIEADRASGRHPLFVCATVGTTSSTAVDPVRPIGEICVREGLWLHVDAAYAGAMCVCPEHRGLIDGVELAHSFNFNPHKWLLTNFDCSALWTADTPTLVKALSITPEYLRNRASESGGVIDYRDWQIPLGRRFRALKLWFVMRHYGLEGLRAHVRRGVELARRFERCVREDERFELAAPRSASLVCFRLRRGDEPTRTLFERVNASGEALLTHTTLPDPSDPSRERFVIRLAVGAPSTDESHVDRAWRALAREADAVLGLS